MHFQTNREATGEFTMPGIVNWLIQSSLQDTLQTPILMGSRGSMVTRWLGEHGTTIGG